jgi:hypothetical protein
MENLQTIERNYLKTILKETLAEVGLISPVITRGEVIRQIGRRRYEKAVRAGMLYRQKADGKNAKVTIDRVKFLQLLRDGKI